MINAIITQYLTQNKRLVIPDFGAFIRKDTGEVVFVEFLKKDDGILNSLIRDSYSLTESEARILAGDFITEVKRQVIDTGTYVITGLGYIKRDDSGVYELEYNPKVDPNIKPLPDINRTKEPESKAQQPAQLADQETSTFRQPQGNAPSIPPASRPAAEDKIFNDRTASPVPPKVVQNNWDKPRQSDINANRPDYGKIYDPVQANPVQGQNINPRPAPARTSYVNQGKRKKADMIMIIAIVAALIAIGSMIYGLLVENDPVMNLQPTTPVQQEQVLDIEQVNGNETE